MLEVLLYLFENYIASMAPLPEIDVLHDELVEVGFPPDLVDEAFDWLQELAREPLVAPEEVTGFHIYSNEEMRLLSRECRSLLLTLEQNGMISPAERELIIERATALKTPIDPQDLKWLILLVLCGRPETGEAFEKIEAWLHQSEGEVH